MRQLSPQLSVCTPQNSLSLNTADFYFPFHLIKHSSLGFCFLLLPPIFFLTHNSFHVLASVEFKFCSALVHIQHCVCSSLPSCPSLHVCVYVLFSWAQPLKGESSGGVVIMDSFLCFFWLVLTDTFGNDIFVWSRLRWTRVECTPTLIKLSKLQHPAQKWSSSLKNKANKQQTFIS